MPIQLGNLKNKAEDLHSLLKIIDDFRQTGYLSPESQNLLDQIRQDTNKRQWLNLFDLQYTTVDGKQGNWTFASRKVKPVLGAAPSVPDAVVIVPLLKDGRKRKLVAIKEFRIPLGDYEWGVPAGLYDHNETADVCAKRELKEETGLKLTKVLYVGPPCVSSAGLSDESVVYVVCECIGTVSNEGNESTEDIKVSLLDVEDLTKLRTSGEKISAKALPFILMFEGLKKITWPRHLCQNLTPKKTRLSKNDEPHP